MMITKTSHQNKNSQMTYSASSISTAVDRWVKGHIKTRPKELLKTLSITFHPTQEQKLMLDRNLRVSNYVYNKAVRYINSGKDKINKRHMRDILVTYQHKNGVINTNLKNFERDVHKDIRDGAVFPACVNYFNCMDAIKAGRIKHFRLKYRSNRTKRFSMTITKRMLKLS